MEAYIRKLYDGRYYIIAGIPENHRSNNKSLGEFCTRRQAIRHAISNGFNLIIRSRSSQQLPGHKHLAVAEKERSQAQ
jgi:hypothetical protein